MQTSISNNTANTVLQKSGAIDHNLITIEIAYASYINNQAIVCLKVTSGTTVVDAISISGIIKRFPEINLDHLKLGIFGKRITNTYILRDHDRIEIYRNLNKTPNQKRLDRSKILQP